MSWRDVEEAFSAAVALSSTERGEFLRALRDEQVDVAIEVESLLAADGAAEGFLERPLLPTSIRGRVGDLDADVGEAPLPETIGPYRILSQIGCGGMSQVFLGERAGGDFAQKVAIKRVRAEIVTEGLIRRFETERQILAQLAHPNIARLVDGGRTEEGLPYLVMEHVEGVPIDVYCDRERLSVDQRLALFLPVCAAVQYAHRNRIVHRDIKVGNILVDFEGVPKLLDFGIAKLLSPELFPLPVEATATRMRPMTPYCASPEQIECGPITAATDVYSLGVLLYQLLTGRLPYDFDEHHPRAVEETILRQPLVPPVEAITAVEAGGPRLEQLAWNRSMPVAALRRALAGDAERIVGMALRKEASRRYASVEELAADIRALCDGRPVAAHGDSIAYRLRKFLGRNRAASWLAALFVLLVLAFALSMTFQVRRLAREQDRAQTEESRVDEVVRPDPATSPDGVERP